MKIETARKILIISFLLAVIFTVLVYRFGSDTLVYHLIFHFNRAMTNGERFRDSVLAYGLFAPVYFIIMQFLQVIFAPVPGELTGFLGGYIFDAWSGFLYSTIGLTIGSAAAFYFGHLLSDILRNKFKKSKTYKKFNHLVFKSDFVIPFVLFLLPGFPKDSLSYLLGMSLMPFKIFLFIACVARMPGTLVLSLEGAQIYHGDYMKFVLLITLSLAVSLPCIIYRRQLLARLGQQNPDETAIQNEK